MRKNNGLLFVGGVLILIGLASLAGTVFHINVWAIFWPLLLILWGVWLLARPFLAGRGWDAVVFGDVRRSDGDPVANEEIWTMIGDVKLDLTHSPIPAGETRYSLYGGIVDAKVSVPAGVGISILASGLVAEATVQGQKYERFLSPIEWKSAGYDGAERKISVEAVCIITDLKVQQG